MKRFAFSVLLSVLAFNVLATGDVFNATIVNVYQHDSDSTVFEFRTDIEQNSCGGVYWRVKSPNDAVANRKFSMILTAYTSKTPVSFYDKGQCEGNRSTVGWIRLEAPN